MRKKNKPAILGGKAAFEAVVPITAPTIPSIVVLLEKYRKALLSGMITNYKNVNEFELRVKKHLGVKHAIAVNSCTSGLILILKAFGLRGEVIMPSFTFHATASAAVWNNLRPVFVDCNFRTYNIDPGEVEKAITRNTSAIIGVHVFGNPADIKRLQKIATRYKLKLIFDAAHGFGIKYRGSTVGNSGDAESFSLSPTKLVTTAEGGIVATNDDDLAKKIRAGRNYGDAGNYDPEFTGLSARMSEFHALLGIESLKFLEKNVSRRNKIVNIYRKYLSNIPGIDFQHIEKGNRSSYKDFSILIGKDKFGLSRDLLYEALLAEKILVKKYFFPPVHKQKAFSEFGQSKKKLDNTDFLAENSLSLPLFSHIPVSVVKKICDSILKIHYCSKQIKRKLKED